MNSEFVNDLLFGFKEVEMKFLLVGINAKYIHSNPGIYSLKAYADKQLAVLREKERSENDNFSLHQIENLREIDSMEVGLCKTEKKKENSNRKDGLQKNGWGERIEIKLLEFTINQQVSEIRRTIYGEKPDWIGISCYIWNIETVKHLTPELAKLLPKVPIWLGGPEVSFHVKEILEKMPEITGIISGEGEETFFQLVKCYGLTEQDVIYPNETFLKRLRQIKGIAFRQKRNQSVRASSREIYITPQASPLDMDTLPFPYKNLEAFENRIIYYETSRGCPFQCAYCLSGIERKLRFRTMDLVRKELSFFLEHKVKQVKFVDRTFNIGHEHSMEILHYIKAHDNGITNFHFEIAADILTEEEIELLRTLRPGLVQLEIGVQSTNQDTLSFVHRKTDLKKLRENTEKLRERRNIHLHLDLIAGLPGENLESFIQSFNQVYAMGGDELQLGFLKLLKGSPMEELQAQYELVTEDLPPYEVLSTKDLSYEDILLLKDVEEMLELYHNSQQFCFAESYFFPQLSKIQIENNFVCDSMASVNPTEDSIARKAGMEPFEFYAQLAEFYHRKKEPVMNSSRVRRYEMLLEYFIYKWQEWENERKDLKYGLQAKETGQKDFLKELQVKEAGENEYSEIAKFRELLTLDYYHRENAKARPDFALSQTEFKNLINDFYKEEEQRREYLKDYEGFDSKQLQRMTHLEILRYAGNGNVNAVLFDYYHRNPVTGGCRMVLLKL